MLTGNIRIRIDSGFFTGEKIILQVEETYTQGLKNVPRWRDAICSDLMHSKIITKLASLVTEQSKF